MKKLAGLLLISLVLCGIVTGQVQSREVPAAADLETRLRFAATQHEIISILLQEKDFEQAVEEFDKILALQFTGENEKLVVQEAWIVAQQLVQARQFELTYRIIDATLEQVQTTDNQFTLLMLKGKVYKDQGKLREALSLYEEARKLQNR